MPSYLLLEDGGKITLEDASGFILLEAQDAQTDPGNTKFGGSEADFESYRRKRRERERELEQARIEAKELKDRLAKAEADLQKKAKAKRESKARKVLQDRVERFAQEVNNVELQISQILIEIRLLEQMAQQMIELDRRKRLLLLTAVM